MAFKLQMEDDSSAFLVALSKDGSEYEKDGCSEKIQWNFGMRLFPCPDDAIH